MLVTDMTSRLDLRMCRLAPSLLQDFPPRQLMLLPLTPSKHQVAVTPDNITASSDGA